MNSGIVGKLRRNPKGACYTFIKDDVTKVEYYYKLQEGEDKAIFEGAKVTYKARPNQNGSGKPSAESVRLFSEGSIQSQKHVTGIRHTEAKKSLAYYLPEDTSNLLFGSSGVTIENTSLKTQKYIRVFHEKEKKLKILDEQTYSNAEKCLLSKLANSQREVLSAYRYNHCVTGILGSRMAVGLGGGSVFETAITLHHTYGFPYIPGSVVKGCLRSYVIRELFADAVKTARNDDEVEKIVLEDEDFVNVFGKQNQIGGIAFLDVFPVSCDKLELDIMNPHYAVTHQNSPGYYQDNSGEISPTDDHKPVPIKFYAVPKNTQFMFRLVSNRLDIKSVSIKDVLLTKLIETTLSEIGIGAKTAVGYGWFGNLKDVTKIE